MRWESSKQAKYKDIRCIPACYPRTASGRTVREMVHTRTQYTGTGINGEQQKGGGADGGGEAAVATPSPRLTPRDQH